MAYVASAAETADGNGMPYLHWHDVEAGTRILRDSDGRGDIEIDWESGPFAGVRVCLNTSEVRALVERLSTMLVQLDGELGTVATCVECGAAIELLGTGTDRWWSHELYPIDHDAVPVMPKQVA